AMKALRLYRNDIRNVIIEAYVPGSGLTVARLIRFKHDCKHIPVFLMSEHLTDDDLKEGKRLGVFDCLVRPFQDVAFLEDRLKKGAEVQGELAVAEENIDPKEHIERELEKITNLPAMPTVYNEIEKLSRNPESTTEQYSHIIEVDPGITAQMLRLCNSSAFSFNRKITSIADAVNLLGLQTVIDFVRTLSVVGAFKGKATAFDATEFWKHCIAVGVAAKKISEMPEFASKLNLGDEDPFMAGMVHDIGKQVLGHFFNDMFQMVQEELKGGITMFQAEQDVLGLTHQEVGEGLASKWQLPEHLVQVIGHHHDPDADLSDMAHLVHLSDVCGKHTGFAFAERQIEPAISEATLEKLEMEQEPLVEIFSGLEAELRALVNDMFGAIFS
ncbi:MAG: HDOD domain-containing protein, partial [Candidatus Latescibacteria bacterium]|nr:HDOD domain-containing protein [Candidatus Latescibacterota bacterium]